MNIFKIMHIKLFIEIIFSLILLSSDTIISVKSAHAEISSDYWDRGLPKSHFSIKSTNGKFYAYIVLLFNENPHFINLIQENSITPEMSQKEDFYIKEYNSYIESVKNTEIKKLAESMLNIFLHPNKFNKKALETIQEELAKLNVILRFSKVKNTSPEKVVLDYCIYGRKEPINISHPLFESQEKIFNIQPFIYYDEFSTSNSTLYFDMIYINPDEVTNDYIIAQNIIDGKNVENMLFVGSRVTEDIKYCIARAFKKSSNIKKEILEMFTIHEITHKILNNQYNYYDQVTGEELSLLSIVYQNPYYGLSVLYAYLDYNRISQHRIAAMNTIRFIANKTEKSELVDDPSELKFFDINEIRRLTKDHFNSIVKNIKNN